jgi:hypothetical protein
MSDPLLRWEALADDFQFNQLPTVRKQAETWRTGLAGLTGLVGASLIVKGRDTVTDLAIGWRITVFVLLMTALVLLVVATLTALLAASGEPGDNTLLTGEDLRRWSQTQVIATQRAIRRARLLTLIGITALGVALAVTWLTPSAAKETLFLVDTTTNGSLCGPLGVSSPGFVTIATSRKPLTTTTVPLADVTRIKQSPRCP